jgi:hypothetical protein
MRDNRDPGAMDRWRRQAAEAEERRERGRREIEREERQAVRVAGIAQLRADIDALRAQLVTDRQAAMEAVAEFIGESLDKIIDRFEEQSARTRNAIMDAIEARFVSLEMSVKAAESRAAKGGFQFARERDPGEIVDLPNPLPPRRLDS